MHRRPLLDMLARYEARWPAEGDVVQRVRELVEAHEDCFERTCQPGHVTGSAWVLSADRRRCLLVHHRKLNRWIQPGGHADGDANVMAVALREAVEETGLIDLECLGADSSATIAEQVLPLDIDVHIIPERRSPTGELIEAAHEHHDIRFLLAAQEESPVVVSEESHDVKWFLPGEIERLTGEESVLRLLRKSFHCLK